jgi:hypothetical protein
VTRPPLGVASAVHGAILHLRTGNTGRNCSNWQRVEVCQKESCAVDHEWRDGTYVDRGCDQRQSEDEMREHAASGTHHRLVGMLKAPLHLPEGYEHYEEGRLATRI